LTDTILPSSFNDTSADLILQEDVAAVSGGPRTIIFYFVRRCCVIHAMLSIPMKKKSMVF